MSKIVKAWHFTGPTLRDGRPLPPDGEWLIHEGPVKMCTSGLHASRRILGALAYAPGPIIHRVECGDVVGEESDKLVCRRRRILWRVDGDALLRLLARRCTLDVICLWDAPEVMVRYLRTGDESLQAATWAAEAAWEAVRAATWDATWDARAAAWARQERRLVTMVHAAHRRQA